MWVMSMSLINPTSNSDLPSKFGPQTESIKAAQAAVDEFVNADIAACEVAWENISTDFDKAKACISARICWTEHYKGVKHLGMRSNRARGLIYLVRKDRLKTDGIKGV